VLPRAPSTMNLTFRRRQNGLHIGSAAIEVECVRRPKSARPQSKFDRAPTAILCRLLWSWIAYTAALFAGLISDERFTSVTLWGTELGEGFSLTTCITIKTPFLRLSRSSPPGSAR
jgi:hypothetical protein